MEEPLSPRTRAHINDVDEVSGVRHTQDGCYHLRADPAGEFASKRPLAVVLGWLGSHRKYVIKYCALLSDSGIDTIAMSMQTSKMMGWTVTAKETASDIVEVVKREEYADRPLLFFTFSNGGGFIFNQIAQIAAADTADSAKLRARMRATVFDSCPGDLELMRGGSAVFGGTDNVFLKLVGAGLLLLNGVVRMDFTYRQRYASAWMDNPLTVPELYLYSKLDKLCGHEFITKVVNERGERWGHDVQGKCWEDSQHVSHMRAHPDEYKHTLFEFLRKHL